MSEFGSIPESDIDRFFKGSWLYPFYHFEYSNNQKLKLKKDGVLTRPHYDQNDFATSLNNLSFKVENYWVS